jgi:hypothetical protein
MDDFVPHIDGRAIFHQRLLDGVDRPDHAGAKTPGLCQNDAHMAPFNVMVVPHQSLG